MASNRELRDDIEALSSELGVSVPEGLERMNNPRLVETLEALQAQRAGTSPQGELPATAGPPTSGDPPAPSADPPSEPQGTKPAPPEPKASAPAPEPVAVQESPHPPRYYVAEGKAITTKKGQVGAFQQVKAHDFPGGQKELDAHCAAGAVVKSDRLRG